MRIDDFEREMRIIFRVGYTTLALIVVVGVALIVCVRCTTGQQHIDWPAVARCAPQPADVVSVVTGILLDDGGPAERSLSDRATAQLESLARERGPAMLACLVDEAVRALRPSGGATHGMGAAAPSVNRDAAADRGRSFLMRIGTRVEREP